MGRFSQLSAEMNNGILEEKAEESCGEALALEHAINDFERLKIKIPDGHMEGDGAGPPEGKNYVGEGGEMLADAGNN